MLVFGTFWDFWPLYQNSDTTLFYKTFNFTYHVKFLDISMNFLLNKIFKKHLELVEKHLSPKIYYKTSASGKVGTTTLALVL